MVGSDILTSGGVLEFFAVDTSSIQLLNPFDGTMKRITLSCGQLRRPGR
jgi:hypothetical protein